MAYKRKGQLNKKRKYSNLPTKKSLPSKSPSKSPSKKRDSDTISSTVSTPLRSTPDRSKIQKTTPSSIYDNARCKPCGNNIYSGSYNNRKRVCYCDRFECPKDCSKCNHEVYIPCFFFTRNY